MQLIDRNDRNPWGIEVETTEAWLLCEGRCRPLAKLHVFSHKQPLPGAIVATIPASRWMFRCTECHALRAWGHEDAEL